MTADASATAESARGAGHSSGVGDAIHGRRGAMIGRLTVRLLPLAVVQNYVLGWVLHYLHKPGSPRTSALLAAPQPGTALPVHDGHGRARSMPLSPWEQFAHFLRDSTIALPFAIGVLLVTTLCVHQLLRYLGTGPDTVRARLVFAAAAGSAAALASAPSVMVHGWLFDTEVIGIPLGQHVAEIALITLRYTFALSLGYVLLFGVPWQRVEQKLDRPAQAAG